MRVFILINIIILSCLSIAFSNLSIFFLGIAGCALLLFLTHKCDQSEFYALSIIYAISISLMLILYFGYMSKYGVPYYIGGSDDQAFEQNAQFLVDHHCYTLGQLLELPTLRYNNSKGFIWILSWIIRFSKIFGNYHTIIFRVINIDFLLMLSVLVYKYFKNHYNFAKNQNLLVLYSFALFPNCLYVSIHVFRDTLISLFLFSVFYIWDSYLSKKNSLTFIIPLLYSIVIAYIAYWIRVESLIFVCGIILISTIVRDTKSKVKSIISSIILLIISCLLLYHLGIWDTLLNYNERYNTYITSSYTDRNLSNAIFSVSLFPYGLILRIIYGLVFPNPISIIQIPLMFRDIDNFFNTFISAGVITQFLMIPYLIENYKILDKVVLIFTLLFFAIIVTTFTFRHFIMIYPFMVILIFRRFFVTCWKTKMAIFFSMVLLPLMGILAYLEIKM